ncbi:MAG TPA: biotin/lipoyl-containing protein, partial [Solirubrobacteraceae bacterium]|nr:biotin/lipoyl-containing protein [Solirubrobacteraceae bacterium]
MADVVMPRLSDSMEEGTILKWLKPAGTEVGSGEELVEIETDKATMTYEADAAGVLEIVAAEGDTLPIGAVIARIGGGGGADASGNGQAAPAAEAAAPEPAAAAEAPAEKPAPAPAAAAPAAPAAPAPQREPGERVKASPLARRLASEQGIDIATLSGTGIG